MRTLDELTDWLRDAYAMERALELSLGKQADNESLALELRERARVHREETRVHAELIQASLQRLGSDTSTIKTGLAQGMELLKSLGTTFARDERVKDVLAAYASEHFEIACYTALRVGALKLGVDHVVAACDQILPEEERMAEWLGKNLPQVVSSYLDDAATHLGDERAAAPRVKESCRTPQRCGSLGRPQSGMGLIVIPRLDIGAADDMAPSPVVPVKRRSDHQSIVCSSAWTSFFTKLPTRCLAR